MGNLSDSLEIFLTVNGKSDMNDEIAVVVFEFCFYSTNNSRFWTRADKLAEDVFVLVDDGWSEKGVLFGVEVVVLAISQAEIVFVGEIISLLP